MRVAFVVGSIVSAIVFSFSSVNAQAVFAGIGAIPCKAIMAEPVAQRMMLSWAQGYMSAQNIHALSSGARSIDLQTPVYPPEAQEGFLKRWCIEHPEDRLITAVAALQTNLLKVQAQPEHGPIRKP